MSNKDYIGKMMGGIVTENGSMIEVTNPNINRTDRVSDLTTTFHVSFDITIPDEFIIKIDNPKILKDMSEKLYRLTSQFRYDLQEWAKTQDTRMKEQGYMDVTGYE